MENLAKGFVYPIILGWVGTEVLIMASQGVAWPLAVGFLLFAVGFVVVGCSPLSDKTVNRAVQLFFALGAAACVTFALRTFLSSPLPGTLKLLGAVALCLVVFRPERSKSESHGH